MGRTMRFFAASLLLCLATAMSPAGATVSPQTLAPDFTLKGTDGRNLRLQEQRGQVVLVNFWATWCGPCRQEMPHLNRLYDKYRASGFTLLAVNIDDDPRTALATATKMGLRFPVLLDTDKTVSKRYDLGSMPATVLIDRDGKVRFLHRGYREGMELSYEQQIRELVKE
jgi:peroxiredoxin